MSAFVVILPQESEIEEEEVAQAFQRCHELVKGRAWLVSDDECYDSDDAGKFRELKTEQRHTVHKEDLHEAVTRLSQASSDLRASVDTLAERTDAIKEHYTTKWFLLSSLIAVGGLIVAALKWL